MRNTQNRILAVLAALLLCLAPVTGAFAEGVLPDLFAAGRGLMFDTHNVTINGSASFALEGEAFREAKIEYRQDGENSFYDLTLINPKNGVVNGYTIIANGEDIYVMEKYITGFYRSGTSDAQSTLVRRTTLLENILNMAELLGGQMEASLGDAISVTETETGRAVRIRLDGAQAEGLIDTGLNLAAEYIAQRYFEGAYFDRRYDEEGRFPLNRESYLSTAAYILDTTRYYTLDALDVTLEQDGEDRFTGVHGAAALYAVGYDGVSRKLEIGLDLALSDYGSTKVDRFNPDDYSVVPYVEWAETYYGRDIYADTSDEETLLDYYFGRAVDVAQACGFPVDYSTNASMASYESFCDALLEDQEKGVSVTVEFDKAEDRLLRVSDNNAQWSDGEHRAAEGLDEILPECVNFAFSFLNTVHPDADQLKLGCAGMVTLEDGTTYVILQNLNDNYVYMVVQAQPEMRVVFYTCMIN